MSPLHPRRGARGDGAQGPPNQAEQELLEVCRQIAELAPQKFNTVREAFRYLRPDHNGRVSRSEVCYFFRAYGVERAQADRLFAFFEPSERDDIDCQEFIEFFRQHIHDDEEPGVQGGTGDASACPPVPESCASAAAGSSCAKISNEFHEMLETVKEKAPQKFSHVREALRIVDVDYDGSITRSEMQNFFRAFGIDEMSSDRFFNKMATGGPGGVNYHTFVQVVGPFLDLPGVVAATNPNRPQSARGRPSSARSRPPSAERRPAIGQEGSVKELLESVLSACGSRGLPAAARDSPRAGSCQERRESSRNRSGAQLSARRNCSAPRELSTCDSPRLPGGSVRSNSKQQERLSSRPCSPAPRHASKELPVNENVAFWNEGACHAPVNQMQGNDNVPEKHEQSPPAPPPPGAGRPGRRPMGIQRGSAHVGVQRVAPVPEKAKDFTHMGDLPAEVVTASTRECLMSDRRPVATPMTPVRRPGSRGRPQCQSP